MTQPQRSIGHWTTGSVAAALVLFALSIWVRGIEGRAASRPEADPESPPVITEAVQFLTPGGYLRLKELDAVVDPEFTAAWQASSSEVFTLEGCPPLLEWMHSKPGLEFETRLRELRSGSETEALCSLVLIFQLARGSDWDPGFLAHTEHAEKLGTLLEAWLLDWAERGVESPLLFESTLSATLLYGRVMRVAYEAPIVGRNESALQRARQKLGRLLGTPGSRTKLGRALQEQHPRALAVFEAEEDCCKGLSQDCATAYPDLDGECES